MPEQPHALIAWGGWEGHTPRPCADLFHDELARRGYRVTLREGTSAYAEPALMDTVDLIVQVITMSELPGEHWRGLDAAVKGGAGFAGFHGGVLDAFRNQCHYQFMVGGQFVAHPGGSEPTYAVTTVDADHAITRGIAGFTLPKTEQYYLHTDPANHVLMTTRFDQKLGDVREYPQGVEVPQAWTRQWGGGKVFIAAWGHNVNDFDVPEAKEIVARGMVWATR